VVISDIHINLVHLGGVVLQPDGRGGFGPLPTHMYQVSDYIAAALGAGLTLVSCKEPRVVAPGPATGGPMAEEWCPEAAQAAYGGMPAAIVLSLRR
jgi:hypothetical protein